MATTIYLHIPFCRVKCPYCDFASVAGREELIPRYVAGLARELEQRLDLAVPDPFAPASVYFGGGTPSLLSPDHVAHLLDVVRSRARPAAPMEVTLEANPGTVDRERLEGFRRAGIGRLTVGVQSFVPRLLRRIGRNHDVRQSRQTLADARAAGFPELGIDLMFGLPGQTRADWERDLDSALGEHPTHLSLYDLTIEPGTRFWDLAASGRMPRPGEAACASMYAHACRRVEEGGLLLYEVSNFALPGSECVHNRAYWRGDPWIGAGAAAHGFEPADGDPDFGRRWWNHRDPLRYLQDVERGLLPEAGDERLSAAEAGDEALLLGLRTREGVDVDRFRARFGIDLRTALAPILSRAIEAGLLAIRGSAIVATQDGRITLDSTLLAMSGQLDRHRRSVTLA